VSDYIYNKDLHCIDITFSELIISRFLTSDIHFILTHPHQGMNPHNWSVIDIEKCLYRLADHVGHPDKFMLLDPVLSQDLFVAGALCKNFQNSQV